ncbi:MAG: PH domain-containing protein [Myxococcales bacterium]|jgi:putative membrane protein
MADAMPLPDDISRLSRPHPSLMTLYVLRAILSGPLIVLVLPLLIFRYQTLRYRFDEQGVHMRWGLLFRREVNVNYARIQDIHVRSGVLQRWLGLADLLVQTASGSAGPEMKIEGFKEFEQLRDFLYTRMRGFRKADVKRGTPAAAAPPGGGAIGGEEALRLLGEIRDELRATREELQRRRRGS